MTEEDWFTVEPKEGPTLDMLGDYKPQNVNELAEWIMIAGRNLVDENSLRIHSPIKPFMAWQMARMMQLAKLKVPHLPRQAGGR